MSQREYLKVYVVNFTNRTVLEEYVRKRGNQAPLYDDECKNCHKIFTVRAFTAVNQFAKYQRFFPPKHCKDCFDVYHGVSRPDPPGNASVRRGRDESLVSVPTELIGKDLSTFRARWEGKDVLLHFKKQVSFSNADESSRPQAGTILTFSSKTVILVPPGEPETSSITYPLVDVAHIEYKRVYVPPLQPEVQWKQLEQAEGSSTSEQSDTPATGSDVA